MNLYLASFLFSEQAREAARRYREEQDPVCLSTGLRRHFTPDQAAALATLIRLRQQASGRFPWAEEMFFTRESLQQSTSWPLALHRAERLHALAPPGKLLELGCGLGGDTLALAGVREVIAYERDPARLLFARENARLAGVGDRVTFVEADWTEVDLPRAAGAFADPSRRRDGKRRLKSWQTDPPLERLLQVQRSLPALAIKAAPGIEEAPPGCSLEFVSHQRTCKEAVLWFGPLAGESRWASLLVGDEWHRLVSSGQAPPQGDLSEGMVLYEPDPAVIRAGALRELCDRLEAHQFDPQIAYLVGRTKHTSPLAQAFHVIEAHRFGLKLLNRRLQALGMARLEIKKRGFPEDPERFRRKLRPPASGGDGVVILTRRGSGRLMLLCRR